MQTPITKKQAKSRLGVSPISPRLRPPKAQTPKSVLKQEENSVVQVSKAKNPKAAVANEAIKSGVAYLDLGENKISPELLKMINQNCCHLNLNKIMIQASDIPKIRELRTLSLENCGISDLSGFPKLDNLRFLSLANNKISNFKGLKILQNLERLDLRNNKSDFPIPLVLNAFGSISLASINGNPVSIDDVKTGFGYSPLVGYSLRCGRPLMKQEEEANELDSSISFLTKDLCDFMTEYQVKLIRTLNIREKEDGYTITCPYKADAIKWFMHVNNENEDNEWSLIPQNNVESQEGVLSLTMQMRLHLIKCEFSIHDTRFSIYTKQPVGREIHEMCLPFPITPQINGIPKEGSLVSLLPIGIPVKIAWTKNEETIAKDTPCITISNNEVGSQVACLLKPFCPFCKEAKFGTIFTMTETVQSISPIVYELEFPEVLVEFELIEFNHVFYPGHEGNSIISVEKARYQYEEWTQVTTLTKDKLEYLPTSEVVGYYLRISYTPITEEEIQGETQFFYSDARVMPSMPSFLNPFIAGIAKTYFPLVACAQYIGGKRGACTYTWYASDTKLVPNSKSIKKATKVGDGMIYTPNDFNIDQYIGVEMIPARDDECIGEPVYAVTDHQVMIENPPQTLENINNVYTNSKITFEEPFNFFISDEQAENGFQLVKQGNVFTPHKDFVGKILRISNDTCDAVVGEILPPIPKINELSIDPFEGGIARLNLKAKSLNLNQIKIVWFRIINGMAKAIAIDTPDYVLTPNDVGCTLFTVVTIINDHNEVVKKMSTEYTRVVRKNDLIVPTIIGSMIEGTQVSLDSVLDVESIIWYRSKNQTTIEEITREMTFILGPEDVGCIIKANITILHLNGGKNMGHGKFNVMISANEVVHLYFPAIQVSVPKSITEGDRVVPVVKSTNEKYTKFSYTWCRKNKNKTEVIANEKDYTSSLKDVGTLLQFTVAPYGSDNKSIGPSTTIDIGPVTPHKPTIEHVKIRQGENGKLFASGKYYGGVEGQTQVEWVICEGKKLLSIGKSTESSILPLPELFNKPVSVIMTPVRSDNEAGIPQIAKNPIVVKPLPTVESADILVKGGKLICGSLLRCKAKIAYASKTAFQWMRSDANLEEWEEIPSATEIEYTPVKEDINRVLMCLVTAINKDGWVSPAFQASTQMTVGDGVGLFIRTRPGKDISIVGSLLQTNISFDQAEQKITWEIWENNKLVDEIQDAEYLLTANNIGQKVRARMVNGLLSEFTNTISHEKTVESIIHSIVKTGCYKFSASATVGQTQWSIVMNASGVVMISKAGSKKQGKWKSLKISAVNTSLDIIELWLDQSSKFLLKPEITDGRLLSIIPKDTTRDFTISVIQGIMLFYSH